MGAFGRVDESECSMVGNTDEDYSDKDGKN